MILLAIALHGGNEDLAQQQLAKAVHAMHEDGVSTYRAWTRVIEGESVDRALDNTPKEL